MRPQARRAPFLAMAALVACSDPAAPAWKDSDAPEDSAPLDSAADDAGPPPHCPDGMSLVGGGSPGGYCFSTFENVLDETTGRASSAPGVVPSFPVSIDEAADACAATPVLDDGGNEISRMRLPTSHEWEDAGDGVVGPGGHPYPYGDSFVEGACATLSAADEQVLDAVSPTQSFPDCVSDWGIYDLVGNLWEWADTGMRLDIDAAFDTFHAAETALEVDADGVLRVPPDAPAHVELRMIGLNTRTPRTAEDGSLRIRREDIQLTDPRQWWAAGYLLRVGADAHVAASYLPVAFVPATAGDYDGEFWLTLRSGDDGARIPDKRGCAYYTCPGELATLQVSSIEHNHDFHGTVGFRCVADPLP